MSHEQNPTIRVILTKNCENILCHNMSFGTYVTFIYLKLNQCHVFKFINRLYKYIYFINLVK